MLQIRGVLSILCRGWSSTLSIQAQLSVLETTKILPREFMQCKAIRARTGSAHNLREVVWATWAQKCFIGLKADRKPPKSYKGHWNCTARENNGLWAVTPSGKDARSLTKDVMGLQFLTQVGPCILSADQELDATQRIAECYKGFLTWPLRSPQSQQSQHSLTSTYVSVCIVWTPKHTIYF